MADHGPARKAWTGGRRTSRGWARHERGGETWGDPGEAWDAFSNEPGAPSWSAAARRLWSDESGLRAAFWDKARRFAARLPFAEDLLAAYYCAFDRSTPTHVKAALVGALAYFVLPFDAVPDVLPLLGFGDDAAVLAAALRLVAASIRPEHREAARQALARGVTES